MCIYALFLYDPASTFLSCLRLPVLVGLHAAFLCYPKLRLALCYANFGLSVD